MNLEKEIKAILGEHGIPHLKVSKGEISSIGGPLGSGRAGISTRVWSDSKACVHVYIPVYTEACISLFH